METQKNLLFNNLKSNQTAVYGRQYQFDKIGSMRDFQDGVPIVSYSDIEPYIARIQKGEQGVLTAERVKFFEPTSGSAGTKKLIPYTQGLLDEFNEATKPWLSNLACFQPRAFRGQHYWSISPAHDPNQYDSLVPVGMDDDADYFDPISRWFIREIMAVPRSLRLIPCHDQWLHQTAHYMLCSKDLSLISVWSPTFLAIILDYIEAHWENLINGLPGGRRRGLSRVEKNGIDWQEVWPQLNLISCWTDGVSHKFATNLKDRLPGIPLQGKGLLTTECFISIPWLETTLSQESFTQGSLLAIGSHFFEFINPELPDQRPCLAHELEKGKEYIPIVTTRGGFYRYRMSDLIRCEGFIQQTPKITFVGKADQVSDVVGEKLSQDLVEKAIRYGIRQSGIAHEFCLVVPPRKIPGSYSILIETNAPEEVQIQFAKAVDDYLQDSHHYAYARRLGQLKPMLARPVANGWQTYQSVMVERGVKVGDIKPTTLDSQQNWLELFETEITH